MATELSIKLSNRSSKQPIKRLPPSLDLPNHATVEDAKIAIARKANIRDHNRIGLFNPATNKTLKDRKASLASLGLSSLLVKDLGLQIPWRVVYVIEYMGPLLFHPLVLFVLRPYIYRPLYPYVPRALMTENVNDTIADVDQSGFGGLTLHQRLTFILMMAHFTKRELETIFLHRFSGTSLPVWNVIRNSFFYWATAGLLAALEVYAPFSPAAAAGDSLGLMTMIGLALFIFGEIANFIVHCYLASLRSPGGTERRLPRGYGFGTVTCPNYMYEIIAWIGAIIISRSPSVVLFISIGASYMYTWGWQKEHAYRNTFGDKYKKKRSVMLPGLA